MFSNQRSLFPQLRLLVLFVLPRITARHRCLTFQHLKYPFLLPWLVQNKKKQVGEIKSSPFWYKEYDIRKDPMVSFESYHLNPRFLGYNEFETSNTINVTSQSRKKTTIRYNIRESGMIDLRDETSTSTEDVSSIRVTTIR